MRGRKGMPRSVIVLAVLALALFVMIQGSTPEPVNWHASFNGRDRIPYGTAALRELLPEILPGSNVRENVQPAYVSASSVPPNSTWLILNDRFAPDEYDTRALLDYADGGGTVMVIAHKVEGDFADTLKFQTEGAWGARDTVGVALVNSALGGRQNLYTFVQRTAGNRMDGSFSSFDTAAAIVLGTTDSGAANAIAIEHGAGRVIVNLLPYAFTNYGMLRRDGIDYAARFLSYIPTGEEIIWDEFYKSGREMVTSPLRYVLAQEGLRWAVWLSMAGMLLAVIFLGRRTQRPIPIVAPPANATVQFVETIAQLYRRRADHRDLAEKKQTYTLESLRHRYGIAPQLRGEEFVRTLAARAGIDRDRAAAMMAAFEWIGRSEKVSEADLLALARTVEETVGTGR